MTLLFTLTLSWYPLIGGLSRKLGIAGSDRAGGPRDSVSIGT